MLHLCDSVPNNCKECQCLSCSNSECPVPCKGNFSCDAPVTHCNDYEVVKSKEEENDNDC